MLNLRAKNISQTMKGMVYLGAYFERHICWVHRFNSLPCTHKTKPWKLSHLRRKHASQLTNRILHGICNSSIRTSLYSLTAPRVYDCTKCSMWDRREEDERVETSFVRGIENGKADEEADEGEHCNDLIARPREAVRVIDDVGHGKGGSNIDDRRLLHS